jgi:hypothetical protein
MPNDILPQLRPRLSRASSDHKQIDRDFSSRANKRLHISSLLHSDETSPELRPILSRKLLIRVPYPEWVTFLDRRSSEKTLPLPNGVGIHAIQTTFQILEEEPFKLGLPTSGENLPWLPPIFCPASLESARYALEVGPSQRGVLFSRPFSDKFHASS